MSRVLDYIDYLRTKPEDERRRIALGYTILLAALILVIWLASSVWQRAPAPTAVASQSASWWSDLSQAAAEVRVGWTTMTERWQTIRAQLFK